MQIPTTNFAEHLLTALPEAERSLKGRSPLAGYLFEPFVEDCRSSTKGRPQPYPWSKVSWDISAVAWIVNPRWVPSALAPSPLLTGDIRWQKQPGRHVMRVAVSLQRDPVFYDLFEKLAEVKS